MEETLNYLVIWKMNGDKESHYETPITVRFNLLDADGQYEWIMDEMEKVTSQREKVQIVNICKLN